MLLNTLDVRCSSMLAACGGELTVLFVRPEPDTDISLGVLPVTMSSRFHTCEAQAEVGFCAAGQREEGAIVHVRIADVGHHSGKVYVLRGRDGQRGAVVRHVRLHVHTATSGAEEPLQDDMSRLQLGLC